MDLLLDESSFDKFFQYVEPDDLFKNAAFMPSYDNETRLRSLRVVDRSFILAIEEGLVALQQYFRLEYGPDVPFEYVSHTNTTAAEATSD
jgi:hypothetical protein